MKHGLERTLARYYRRYAAGHDWHWCTPGATSDPLDQRLLLVCGRCGTWRARISCCDYHRWCKGRPRRIPTVAGCYIGAMGKFTLWAANHHDWQRRHWDDVLIENRAQAEANNEAARRVCT